MKIRKKEYFEMPPTPITFTQIAVASDSENGESLYALDSLGRLWERIWKQNPEYVEIQKLFNAAIKADVEYKLAGVHIKDFAISIGRELPENTYHHVWELVPMPTTLTPIGG
jgi:hypothetical protein